MLQGESSLLESPTKRGVNRMKLKDNLWGWLFISLPIIGTVVFVFVPLGMTIYASFTSWSGSVPLEQAKTAGMFGFAQYIKAFTDEHFWSSLRNTIFYMIGIPIGMIISLLLAVCMNRKIKFTGTFRVIYYIPVVASVVSVSLLFSRLFDVEGIINRIIGVFGFDPVLWTQGSGALKMTTIVIMMTWKGLGGTILLFIAGLQGVNTLYIEAAKLDGAGSAKIFFKIIMPQLQPVIFYVLITSIIGGAQIYTEPALFYPKAGYEVKPLVQYLYEMFTQRKAGYSAAIGVILGLMVFCVTAVQFFFNNRKEKNNG